MREAIGSNLKLLFAVLASCIALISYVPRIAHANDTDIALGDTITYSIEQTVNDLGTNAFVRYNGLVISDELPDEVRYTGARMYLGDDDITALAGNVIYNPIAHRVAFVFSEAYLASGMALDAETYRFEIETIVESLPENGTIENSSTSTFNGLPLESNTTVAKTAEPELAISKQANKEIYAASETIDYTLRLAQETPGAAVRDISIKDSVPQGLSLIADSVEASGAGNPQVSVKGNDIEVSAERIGYAEEIVVTYSCTPTEAAYGLELANTAKATGFGLSAEQAGKLAATANVTVTLPVTYYVDGKLAHTDDNAVAGTPYSPHPSIAADNTKENAAFSGWYLDEGLKTPYDPAANGMIGEGLSLYAKNIYEIDASATEGGAVSDPGITQHYYGSNATYTFEPEERFAIDWIEIDGVNVGAIDAYTFESIDNSHAIVAHFKQVVYDVTFTDELTSEEIDVQEVWEGTGATDPGAPEHEGYDFVGWDRDFSSITGDMTVTARYEAKTTSLTVNKTWDDDNDRDGIRTDAVFDVAGTINEGATSVYAGTLTVGADSTGATLEGLPAYAELQCVSYAIAEHRIDGYIASEPALSGSWQNGWAYAVTNTHRCEATAATIAKVWDDDGDRDGIRPRAIEVTLAGSDGSERNVTLSEDDGWTTVVNGLPVYSDHGIGINYSLAEETVEGYASDVRPAAGPWSFHITNSHKAETIDIPVRIEWADDKDRDGIRPDAVTVTLAGSDGSVHTKEVTQDMSWKGVFTNLPRYHNHGTETEYTLTETAPDGYSCKVEGDVSGFTVTNSHSAKTMDVTVNKVWNDAGDQDGVRPDSIGVTLVGTDGSSREATLDAEDGWSHTWEDVPANRPHGIAIDYAVNEVPTGSEDYRSAVNMTRDEHGNIVFTLTNSHEPATATVAIEGTWADDDDRDGIRPGTQEVTLLGSDCSERTITLKAEDGWAALAEDLPMFAYGKLIDYTVRTEAPSGYSAEVAKTGGYAFAADYEHAPDTRSIDVTKAWLDDDNALGTRTGAEFTLTGSDGSVRTIVLETLDDEETVSFAGLPVNYDHGREIEYRLAEAPVKGYASDVRSTSDDSAYRVENLLQDTISIPVRKVWMNDAQADRPDRITFELVLDGEVVATQNATAEGNWSCTFESIERFDDAGAEIPYEIRERTVEGYSAEAVGSPTEGFTVTNTHEKGAPAAQGDADPPEGAGAGPPEGSPSAQTGDGSTLAAALTAALIAATAAAIARSRHARKGEGE